MSQKCTQIICIVYSGSLYCGYISYFVPYTSYVWQISFHHMGSHSGDEAISRCWGIIQSNGLGYTVNHTGNIVELTHWSRDKMAAIFQTTISNAFSWMRMYKFRSRFHWSLLQTVPLILFQHWFRQWLGADQATSHYLNQWWLVHWRIYASLGLNEITHWALEYINKILDT